MIFNPVGYLSRSQGKGCIHFSVHFSVHWTLHGGGCSLGPPGSPSKLKVLLPALERGAPPRPLPSSWVRRSSFKVVEVGSAHSRTCGCHLDTKTQPPNSVDHPGSWCHPPCSPASPLASPLSLSYGYGFCTTVSISQPVSRKPDWGNILYLYFIFHPLLRKTVQLERHSPYNGGLPACFQASLSP